MQAADDAQGHRAFQSERGAEGDRPIAHLHGFRITQGSPWRQLIALETHQGQVRDRIGAHHLAIPLFPVGQGDADGLHPIHHMGIGEHKALGIDHHTRALAPFPLRTCRRVPQQVPQQGIKQRGVKRLTFHGALGVDPNHRRGHPLNGIGHKAVLQGLSRGTFTDQDRYGHQNGQELTQGVPQHKTSNCLLFIGSSPRNGPWSKSIAISAPPLRCAVELGHSS